MTNTELSWAKSQSWWNDFTNIYSRTMWAMSVNFEDYVHEHCLEMVALDLINDENLNDTDNMILARITNACLDHVNTPDIQEYSASQKMTEPAKDYRQFNCVSKTETVCLLVSDHTLLEKEKHAVFEQLAAKGVVWDEVCQDGKIFEFYRTTNTLVEL